MKFLSFMFSKAGLWVIGLLALAFVGFWVWKKIVIALSLVAVAAIAYFAFRMAFRRKRT